LIQPPQDDLVEPRLSATSQESVELYIDIVIISYVPISIQEESTDLDKKHEVRVLGTRGGTLTLLDVVLFDINTLSFVNHGGARCED